MNRDEMQGKAEKAKGYIKDKAGEILNDPDLEAEGEVERGKGTLREGYGKAKEKVGDAVESVKDKAREAADDLDDDERVA
ncbi:MAG TPA: CsbD family protein [Candidatus Limnocylindria bacterium]|nr:CsbD family protein [Candidatus Limnocylindria bacterium]